MALAERATTQSCCGTSSPRSQGQCKQMPNRLGQELEINFLTDIAPLLSNPTFVDVGAERGAVAEALFGLGLKGTLFEPLERHLNCLTPLAQRHGGRIFNVAISDSDGVRPFHIATNAAGEELDHFHSLERADGGEQFHHGRSVLVQCRSLVSLVREGVVPSRLGILKVDTEGCDLAVLRGLGSLRPELVICEYFTAGLYDGWPDGAPEPLIALMESLGYNEYVAIKRGVHGEISVPGPCAFAPGQWGNLLFFEHALYLRARDVIAQRILASERLLLDRLSHLHDACNAKEAVIQGLKSALEATEQRARQQIASLEQICAERLELIERLDEALRRHCSLTESLPTPASLGGSTDTAES